MSASSKKIFSIALTAMLSALAFVLMFVEVPIPLMPAFIKFDVSDLPAVFGAFTLGPLYGVLIELIKNLLHILIKGTSSAFVGEMSNFLLGAVFVLVAGLIYQKKRTFGGVLLAAVAGALAMGVASLPMNYFLVYPAYVKFYHLPLAAIIGMYQEILPTVAGIPSSNALLNCLLIFNVPFTAAKGLVDALLCLAIYQPLSHALRGKLEL